MRKRDLSSPEACSSMSKKSNIAETNIMGEVSTAINAYLNSQEAMDMFEKLFSRIIAPVIASITKDVSKLEVEKNILKGSVSRLEEKVVCLEETQDIMDQEQRKCTLIVVNQWPEKHAEVPFLIFKNFCSKELNYTIENDSIIQCFRIGKAATNHNPRSVLVQFRSHQTKKDILDARRSKYKNVKNLLNLVKGDPVALASMKILQTVYFNDDLTSTRRMILSELRALKKSKQIADCWVYDGRISYKANDETVVHNVSKKMLNNLLSEKSDGDPETHMY